MVGYFSHDSNSRNDEKIIRLRMELGAEGYGIYFMLLERLRENKDYTSSRDYEIIAFDLRVDANKIKKVVEDFDLFVLTEDGEHFYSNSFMDRMAIKDKKEKAKSENARRAAEARWKKQKEKEKNATEDNDNSDCNTNAMQSQNDSNSDEMRSDAKERKKESKESKESKRKESKETKEKKETYNSIILDYTSDLNLQKALQDYVAYRKSNPKKPFTIQALKLNLNNLTKSAKSERDKIQIVNNSIEKGWLSFYPLRSNSNFDNRLGSEWNEIAERGL